jgi:hypothetical protein
MFNVIVYQVGINKGIIYSVLYYVLQPTA